MKLSELKVGMKVRQRKWLEGDWLKIEWISGNYFAGHDEDNDPFAQRVGDKDEFQIVEPRKKPSERLAEISQEVSPRCDPDPNDVMKIIGRYLDEQASEQK